YFVNLRVPRGPRVGLVHRPGVTQQLPSALPGTGRGKRWKNLAEGGHRTSPATLQREAPECALLLPETALLRARFHLQIPPPSSMLHTDPAPTLPILRPL